MVDPLTQIADEIGALLDGTDRVLIGITGPPGAGKSTVATALVTYLGPAGYLPMDGFHLPNTQLDKLGRRNRKGAVDTFDVDGYVATLQRVMAAYGRADVRVPDFDRALDEPVPDRLVVPAQARLIVTEGNYLGVWQPVRAMMDRLYYLDRPAPERRASLVARHMAGGRGRGEAEAWVDDVDEPNATLIESTRSLCDRVLLLGATGE